MQFDVYPAPAGHAAAGSVLVDVQADLLSDLPTRLVVPLVPADRFGRRASRLHPLLSLNGQSYVLAAHLLAAIERRHLTRPLGSLASSRDSIVAAIDVLLAGV